MTRTAIARIALATGVALAVGITVVAAQEARPGPVTTHSVTFEESDAPDEFGVVTMVLDFAPGARVPLHVHPGRGTNIVLAGELVEIDGAGDETVHTLGDGWIEEQGREHVVENRSDAEARLLFTLLVPEGEDVITVLE